MTKAHIAGVQWHPAGETDYWCTCGRSQNQPFHDD